VVSDVTNCCQVTTTLPDRISADQLAETLVAERLAACAQVLGPVSSTYRWEGRVEHSEEWYCTLKTTDQRLSALQQRVRELHPYQTPELIVLPITGGDAQYLDWVRSEANGRES
jgi:periplasmic divalent cation tolerance protein